MDEIKSALQRKLRVEVVQYELSPPEIVRLVFAIYPVNVDDADSGGRRDFLFRAPSDFQFHEISVPSGPLEALDVVDVGQGKVAISLQFRGNSRIKIVSHRPVRL